MEADDLLTAPRGRRLCWHLFGGEGYVMTERTLPAARDGLPAVLERLGSADAGTAEWLREALIFAVDTARHYQGPDEIDDFVAASEVLVLLRPVAAAVAAHPSVGWWESPLAIGDQWFVRFHEPADGGVGDTGDTARPPELTGVASRLQHQREREEGRTKAWRPPPGRASSSAAVGGRRRIGGTCRSPRGAGRVPGPSD